MAISPAAVDEFPSATGGGGVFRRSLSSGEKTEEEEVMEHEQKRLQKSPKYDGGDGHRLLAMVV